MLEAIWKEQSDQLRNALKNKSTNNEGMVKCPHCNRKFDRLVAERHIPLCENIKAKPKTLKRREGSYNKILKKMNSPKKYFELKLVKKLI